MNKRLRQVIPMILIAATTLTAFAQEPVVKETPAAITQDIGQELPEEEIIQEEIIQEEIIEEVEEIEATKEDSNTRKMLISLDSDIALINDIEHKISTKPFVKDGRTYLPLRFTGEKLLDGNVVWDDLAKEATVTNTSKIVRVRVGSKTAHINGDQVQIEEEVMIIKGRTYLPLRVMAGLFDIKIDYDEPTRSVTLISKKGPDQPDKPDKPIVIQKPIAEFEFDKDNYTAGQTLRAIDKSYHEQGKVITNTEWMVNFDSSLKRKSLSQMFSKPNAGTYDISLRVEAGPGNWSEWETKRIIINPNKAPEVTLLNTHKDEYAAGEELGFTYTFDNEPWEGIKNERWTYRGRYEPVNRAVIEKPKYIFHPGEYIITLRLEDDFGNLSETKETIVTINNDRKQSELEYRFKNGQLGDAIDNFQNFNFMNYPAIEEIDVGFAGGKLIFSNSPEKVKDKGILYKDKARGKGKLVFHHLNSFTAEENTLENKRLVLIAKNPTDKDVKLTLEDMVTKGPSNDILFVGQSLLYDYLRGTPTKNYTIKPGEEIYIYDSGKRKWKNGEIIAGKMDYDILGELEFTVASVGADTQISEIKDMVGLSRDEHPRGTFDYSDIFFDVEPQTDEPSKIVLGALMEEWLPGYDGLTNMPTENRGNFGATYTIKITAKEDMGVILNPRAGTFRGALRWDYEDAFLAPNRGYIMGHNSKAINLGVIKAGQTRILEYTLPNGSAAPVLIGFIPKSHWN